MQEIKEFVRALRRIEEGSYSSQAVGIWTRHKKGPTESLLWEWLGPSDGPQGRLMFLVPLLGRTPVLLYANTRTRQESLRRSPL